MTKNREDKLLQLLETKTVVKLADIREALGGVSSMTAFRYLKKVPYRHSYNHNGRYYTQHEVSQYDRFGLWSFGDIHFSIDGSLRKSVRRLVHEADAGATNSELKQRLRVRVQNTLLDLYRKGEVDRERLAAVYVYLHTDARIREEQIHHRRAQVADQQAALEANATEVSEHVVIQVLLTLIRHPESTGADVVRHFRGHSPPINITQVRTVFTRYDLGEKRGPSSY